MSWGRNILGKFIYYQLNNLCSGRVYPVVAPQLQSFPLIVYTIISTVPDNTKDSRSVADKCRVEVAIYDKTYDSVNLIGDQVREQLDKTSGYIAGVQINQCRFDDDVDLFESNLRIHHKVQDYLVRIDNDIDSGPENSIQTEFNKSADFTSSNVLAPGYTIQLIVIENLSLTPGQLSCGTTSGANNVFSSEPIKENGLTTIPVNKTFSLTDFTSLYFNAGQSGDTWVTINAYIVLLKIK